MASKKKVGVPKLNKVSYDPKRAEWVAKGTDASGKSATSTHVKPALAARGVLKGESQDWMGAVELPPGVAKAAAARAEMEKKALAQLKRVDELAYELAREWNEKYAMSTDVAAGILGMSRAKLFKLVRVGDQERRLRLSK